MNTRRIESMVDSLIDSATGKPQSPWDVMWEYILDDFESDDDDDDDDTLPTVSTRGTLNAGEDAVIPVGLLKEQWIKAARGISDFALTDILEERDESSSHHRPWRLPQRKSDLRQKNGNRKLKWSGFGIKNQVVSNGKKQNLKTREESILDKASLAAAAVTAGVKEVNWEEAGDALIEIFDVVQPSNVGIRNQNSSDSSSGDSESKGYSYNSNEEDSFSHNDVRLDRNGTRSSGLVRRDQCGEQDSFLEGSKTRDSCFVKPSLRRGNQKKETKSHPNTSFSGRVKDVGDFKDTSVVRHKDSMNNDGSNQLRKFACFVKGEDSELDVIHQLDDLDSKFFFPAARMVSDFEGQIPVSLQMNSENGVMGIPADKFLGAKGPQSLYSYDYQGKVHMDIVFNKFGNDPNECISIRKFESFPTLKPEDGNKVLVQIEASTVSTRDCHMRQGKLKDEKYRSLPLTPGVDFVGKVIAVSQSISSSFSLYPGQSVLSLVQVGGNSRYLSVDPERLVKVPEGMDPAEVVCLCTIYLSAFQSLHYGQVAFSRYAEKSLEGKTVLIVGSIVSTFGKAVMELVVEGSAAIVFATAKRKYWRMLLGLGIIPLPDDSMEWLNRVQGTVDLALIVGKEEQNQTRIIQKRALRKDGRLVICGGEEVNSTAQSPDSRLIVHDVHRQWEEELEVSKRDIQHLIGLLEKEKLRPKVLDRFPLAKVADAQKLIESSVTLSGFLVCEPWMKTKKRALYL